MPSARELADTGRIEIVTGDITRIAADAIVNAANESLLGGGGVDGAIHRAAGPALLEECRGLGGCPTGEARVTAGYDLPARHVIHTVGPIWAGGNRGEDDLLRNAYRNSLDAACELGVRRVVFPAISTGVYRFPLARATALALDQTTAWLAANTLPETVIFVCFDSGTENIYRQALE